MFESFGFYFTREVTFNQPLDIPNYYLGWVSGIGIIWKGKRYIPEFMRAIGGPPVFRGPPKIDEK